LKPGSAQEKPRRRCSARGGLGGAVELSEYYRGGGGLMHSLQVAWGHSDPPAATTQSTMPPPSPPHQINKRRQPSSFLLHPSDSFPLCSTTLCTDSGTTSVTKLLMASPSPSTERRCAPHRASPKLLDYFLSPNHAPSPLSPLPSPLYLLPWA
jgi:hypothetical protein